MTIGVRPDLAELEPYDPDMRPVRVMLSANENNWGVPAAVQSEALRRLAQVPLNRYPQATSPRLREQLGDMWGVAPRNVVVANGGDELLFNLLLAYGGQGRRLVNCPPTFSAYALYAELTATGVVSVPRDPDTYEVDFDALAQAAADPAACLVVLTSPNNPTGNLVRAEQVRRLAASTQALVLVDEAYAEFCDPQASCMGLVSEFPNVCVLRTLSKAYALAGARIGYLICSDEVADAMLAVRLPYSVNSMSQAVAETVVQMRGEYAPVVAEVVRERERLGGLLAALGDKLAAKAGVSAPRLRVWPSEANFVMVRIPGPAAGTPTADQIHELLAADSILVRNFSHTAGLEGCLRISVGKPEEDDELLASLRRHLGLSTASVA
jgi:histidinol-phosphate aminotransferase